MTVYLWNLTAYAIQLAAVAGVALASLWCCACACRACPCVSGRR